MIVVRKPGVQKPHCRPWHSRNACCTGPERAVGVGQPLDGGDLGVRRPRPRTSGRTRIGPAVDQHRAGAADAVLAADVGAGQAEVVAQRVGEQPPGGHPTSWATPLTVRRTSCSSSVMSSLSPVERARPRRRTPRDDARGQHPDQLARGSRRWRGCRRPGRARARASSRPPQGRRRPRRQRLGQVDHGGHVAHRQVAGAGPTTASPVEADQRARRRTARSRRAGGRSPSNADPGARRPAPGRTPTPRSRRGAARTPAARRTGRRPAIVRRAPHGPATSTRAAEQAQHHRHLGRRVGVHERADRRAAVADRRRGRRGRAPATAAAGRGVRRSDASTSACRARRPDRGRPSASDRRRRSRPGSPLMSTSSDGAASRIDSSGTRLCPPASTLAPGSPARASSASLEDPRPDGRRTVRASLIRARVTVDRRAADRRRVRQRRSPAVRAPRPLTRWK